MATAVGLNMKITADTAGIGRGMSQTERMLAKLGKSASSAAGSLRSLVAIEVGSKLASAFTGAARGAAAYAMQIAKTVDSTAKVAQRTGIAVEALQGFQVAADLSGVQNLEGALQKVSVVLGDAAAGSGSAQKAFTNIGLSVDELMRMAPDDQFRAIAAAIADIEDPSARAAAAVDLFGKSGVELLPMFASNLEEVESQAKRLGIVLSGEQVASIEEMNDSLDLVGKTFDGIIAQVTANLAPMVSSMAQEFLAFVEAFNGASGEGGGGIANALTESSLEFAEYLASVFDAAFASFSEFGATMQGVSAVFEFVANTFVAASEALRGGFNIFEIAGNGISLALGKAIEYFGSYFSSAAEDFGRRMAESAQQAIDSNQKEADSAFGNAGAAASAAVFGGSIAGASGDGPASAAVRAARERFEARDPARIAAEDAGTPQQVQQQIDAEQEAIRKAQEDAARKAQQEAERIEQQRLDKIAALNEQYAKESSDIESNRLDALSRQSQEALQVNDIRSGGMSQFLALATGREDPAVEQMRQQLRKLDEIKQALAANGAVPVAILGGA